MHKTIFKENLWEKDIQTTNDVECRYKHHFISMSKHLQWNTWKVNDFLLAKSAHDIYSTFSPFIIIRFDRFPNREREKKSSVVVATSWLVQPRSACHIHFLLGWQSVIHEFGEFRIFMEEEDWYMMFLYYELAQIIHLAATY